MDVPTVATSAASDALTSETTIAAAAEPTNNPRIFVRLALEPRRVINMAVTCANVGPVGIEPTTRGVPGGGSPGATGCHGIPSLTWGFAPCQITGSHRASRRMSVTHKGQRRLEDQTP